MGDDKWPEGPIRRYWFEKGYKQRELDEVEEEDAERSPLDKITEEERQNIGRNLKRLRNT
jgi:hypothetical protein